MAKLAQVTSEVQKYDMPSTTNAAEADKAWVVLRKGKLLGGEQLLLTETTDRLDFGMRVLATRIQEWNFEDNGTPIPITEDNVRRMEAEDLAFLLNEIAPSLVSTDELADPKKNELSLDTSTPS